jgi:beta-N-acetylhexosaminidase
LALVESGEIPESRIDESVRRILRLKADYGLLEWQPNQTSEITDTDAQAQLLEIAQHSVTIVQDEAGLLPLHSTENLLFIYPDVISEVVEILQAKQESAGWLAVGLDPSTGDIQTATQRVASYDKIVIFTANTTRHPDQATLVRTIVDTGQPVVVVALALPYDSALLPESISYVATYGFSRVMLTSMADVLFGVIPARGKLPVR